MKQLPEDVKKWIDDPNRNFWDGMSILSELTSNKTLIRNLSRKENKYNKEKLFNEIKKLRKNLPAPITTPPLINDDEPGGQKGSSQSQQPALNDDANDDPPADHHGGNVTHTAPLTTHTLPPVTDTAPNPNADDAKAVEELQITYSKMYNLKGILSNEMRDLAEDDNDGRKERMARIQDINQSMTDIDEKIKHFKQHGSLPVIPPLSPDPPGEYDIPADPFLASRKMTNERSNISKLRKQIAKGDPNPEVIKELEEKLRLKMDLVDRIKKQLHVGDGS